MNEIMPAVHPWTLDWYETLPESYRILDKHQLNPTPEDWPGLTPDPTFFYGWGDWSTTAPLQTVSEIMVSMTQTFQGVTGEPIHAQVWWDAPIVAGTLLQIARVDDAQQIIEEVTVEPVLGEAGDTGIMFYPTGSGKFTIRILVLVPAPEGNLLEVLAVNVGPKQVVFTELPTGGITPATARPLLRYMDGIGRVGGGFRDTSDALWDGVYTDPRTVPDESLQWLAQIMGVPTRLRGQLTNERLREYMMDMSTNGRKGAGTRTAIAEAAKGFLTGERMVEVMVHGSIPHTLVILVKPDEVPGGNLQRIVEMVRAAGVIPAGHDLIAKEAIASWDAWQAAAGTTWAQLEAAAPTWVRADSLGINLEG